MYRIKLNDPHLRSSYLSLIRIRYLKWHSIPLRISSPLHCSIFSTPNSKLLKLLHLPQSSPFFLLFLCPSSSFLPSSCPSHPRHLHFTPQALPPQTTPPPQPSAYSSNKIFDYQGRSLLGWGRGGDGQRGDMWGWKGKGRR